MSAGPLRERLLAGEQAVGVITGVDSADFSEILAMTAFDFVMVDMEHGAIDVSMVSDLVRAIRAGGSVPLARVTDHNPKRILRVLDAGMGGIMVPQVNSAAEAKAVARAARYHPEGSRGLAPTTPAARWASLGYTEQIESLNRDTLVIAQVETEKGVREAAAIAGTDGIDAVVVGPADLSQSLGVPGEVAHPRVAEARRAVADAAVEAGKVAGTVGSSVKQVQQLQQEGYSLFLTGWLGLLRRGLEAQIQPIVDHLDSGKTS